MKIDSLVRKRVTFVVDNFRYEAEVLDVKDSENPEVKLFYIRRQDEDDETEWLGINLDSKMFSDEYGHLFSFEVISGERAKPQDFDGEKYDEENSIEHICDAFGKKLTGRDGWLPSVRVSPKPPQRLGVKGSTKTKELGQCERKKDNSSSNLFTKLRESDGWMKSANYREDEFEDDMDDVDENSHEMNSVSWNQIVAECDNSAKAKRKEKRKSQRKKNTNKFVPPTCNPSTSMSNPPQRLEVKGSTKTKELGQCERKKDNSSSNLFTKLRESDGWMKSANYREDEFEDDMDDVDENSHEMNSVSWNQIVAECDNSAKAKRKEKRKSQRKKNTNKFVAPAPTSSKQRFLEDKATDEKRVTRRSNDVRSDIVQQSEQIEHACDTSAQDPAKVKAELNSIPEVPCDIRRRYSSEKEEEGKRSDMFAKLTESDGWIKSARSREDEFEEMDHNQCEMNSILWNKTVSQSDYDCEGRRISNIDHLKEGDEKEVKDEFSHIAREGEAQVFDESGIDKEEVKTKNLEDFSGDHLNKIHSREVRRFKIQSEKENEYKSEINSFSLDFGKLTIDLDNGVAVFGGGNNLIIESCAEKSKLLIPGDISEEGEFRHEENSEANVVENSQIQACKEEQSLFARDKTEMESPDSLPLEREDPLECEGAKELKDPNLEAQISNNYTQAYMGNLTPVMEDLKIEPGSRVRIVKEGKHLHQEGTITKFLRNKGKWGIRLDITGKKVACEEEGLELLIEKGLDEVKERDDTSRKDAISEPPTPKKRLFPDLDGNEDKSVHQNQRDENQDAENAISGSDEANSSAMIKLHSRGPQRRKFVVESSDEEEDENKEEKDSFLIEKQLRNRRFIVESSDKEEDKEKDSRTLNKKQTRSRRFIVESSDEEEDEEENEPFQKKEDESFEEELNDPFEEDENESFEEEEEKDKEKDSRTLNKKQTRSRRFIVESSDEEEDEEENESFEEEEEKDKEKDSRTLNKKQTRSRRFIVESSDEEEDEEENESFEEEEEDKEKDSRTLNKKQTRSRRFIVESSDEEEDDKDNTAKDDKQQETFSRKQSSRFGNKDKFLLSPGGVALSPARVDFGVSHSGDDENCNDTTIEQSSPEDSRESFDLKSKASGGRRNEEKDPRKLLFDVAKIKKEPQLAGDDDVFEVPVAPLINRRPFQKLSDSSHNFTTPIRRRGRPKVAPTPCITPKRPVLTIDLTASPSSEVEDKFLNGIEGKMRCLTLDEGHEKEESSDSAYEGDENKKPLHKSKPMRWNQSNKRLTKRNREQLTSHYFSHFNSKIFQEELPNIPITWNNRLNTTGGCTRFTKNRVTKKHEAQIELATKVIDTEERLRQTLCHEMCHAACWIISKVAKPPHGRQFKAWGRVASKICPGIVVNTCHNYQINYRFRWKCENPSCGNEFGRHSDSLDVTKKVCGRCRGSLIKIGRFNKDGTPYKPKKPNKFALFVKENINKVRRQNPGTPHRDIMKLVAAKYRESK